MTLAPLDFDFPLMSSMSKRPPHSVPAEEQSAELDQELADRRAFYGRLVAREKMSKADADRHIAILEAIHEDFGGGLRRENATGALPSRIFSWDEKIRELRRELSIRRGAWPKRVASAADPLDAATAARRMERLEAVHFRYWIELRHCDQFEAADFQSTLEKVRAFTWRVEHWEREAWRRGEPAVRPAMADYYGALDAGDVAATRIWNALEDAARREGFCPPAADQQVRELAHA